MNQAFSQSTAIQSTQQSYMMLTYHWKPKNELSSLLQGDRNSIISKSPIDVGRTNYFQMDIPTVGLLIACKSYQKYQKFIDDEIRLSEKGG